MNRSEQINELMAALATAAKSFPAISRNCSAKVTTKAGGSYSYDYADLDDILSAVRGPLADNGLVLIHDCIVKHDEAALIVETTATLYHSSGQWISSSPLPIPCDGTMSAAQLIGSGQTYGRRYTAQSLLGLSTETDDDAYAAGGSDATTGKSRPCPPCPKCGLQITVIRGREEYGGGYVCYQKKGGCGHKWHDAPTEKGREIQQQLAKSEPLTLSERNVVDTLRDAITRTTSIESLTAIGEDIKEMNTPRIAAEVREFYAAKRKLLETTCHSDTTPTDASSVQVTVPSDTQTHTAPSGKKK